MYDEVYEAMVKAGVAEKLSEPMWVDEKQQATEEKMLLDKRQLTFCSVLNMLYLWTKLAATQVKKGMELEVEKRKS
jgi:hypothetical protein